MPHKKGKSSAMGELEVVVKLVAQRDSGASAYPPRISLHIGNQPQSASAARARDIAHIFEARNRIHLVIGSGCGEVSRALWANNAQKVVNFEDSEVLKALSLFSDALSDVSQDYIDADEFLKPHPTYHQIIDLRLHRDLTEIPRLLALPCSVALLCLVSERALSGFVDMALQKGGVCMELDRFDLATSPAEPDRFIMLAYCASKSRSWEAILRLQESRLKLSTYHLFDVWASDMPTYKQTKADYQSGVVAKIVHSPADIPAHVILSRAPPTNMHSSLYWMEFLRGIVEFQKDSGSVNESNPYIKCIFSMIENGHIFDPGAMKNVEKDAFQSRLIARMKNALEISRKRDDELDSDKTPSVSLISVEGIQENILLRDAQGNTLARARALDGHHRVGARILLGGGRLYHGHVLKIHGKFL